MKLQTKLLWVTKFSTKIHVTEIKDGFHPCGGDKFTVYESSKKWEVRTDVCLLNRKEAEGNKLFKF